MYVEMGDGVMYTCYHPCFVKSFFLYINFVKTKFSPASACSSYCKSQILVVCSGSGSSLSSDGLYTSLYDIQGHFSAT